MTRTIQYCCRLARIARLLLCGQVLLAGVGLYADENAQPVLVGQVLYLDLIVNHARQNILLRVNITEDDFLSTVAELREAGFRLEGRKAQDVVSLKSLPGLQLDFDPKVLSLSIIAPSYLLTTKLTRIVEAEKISYESAPISPGLLLNYDTNLSSGEEATSLLMGSEIRLFGLGNFSVSQFGVWQSGRHQGLEVNRGYIPQNTYAEWVSPDREKLLRAGDVLAGKLNWTRQVRLRGIHLEKTYEMQPYRIVSPMLKLSQEASLPSVVSLSVNGVQHIYTEVPLGPFEIEAVPGMNGYGTAELQVRDILGNVTTQHIPYYSTARILAGGISSWSLDIGRIEPAQSSYSFIDVDRNLVRADYRLGYNDSVTLEVHGEVMQRNLNLGIGAIWSLNTLGVFNASVIEHQDDSERGRIVALGYDWSNGMFALSLGAQRSSEAFSDAASLYGYRPPVRNDRVGVSYFHQRFGSIGLQYFHVRQMAWEEQDSRNLTLSWNKPLSASTSVNFFMSKDSSRPQELNYQLNLTLNFGGHRQLSSSVAQRSQGMEKELIASSNMNVQRGFGWRLRGREGMDRLRSAEVQLAGDYGRVQAGVSRWQGRDAGYLQGVGSMVLMGGGVHLAPRVDDAVALVEVEGIPGVPVRLENRIIGHTNRHGQLLVAGLNAWQENRLAVDITSLPLNYQIEDYEKRVTPSRRAGTIVPFRVRRERAALVRFVDEAGEPIALGARVVPMNAEEPSTVIGFDGESFLRELDELNRFRVLTPGSSCVAQFELTEFGSVQAYIGPVVCRQEVRP